jgi:hypothetical protein
MNVVSALVALIAAACSSNTVRVSPPRPDSAYNAQLASGMTHQYRWYAAGPWAVHTISVDPGACGTTFRTIKAQDRAIGRETTSSMARRANALVAINADFFSFDPAGVSEGPQIQNGNLLKSEGSHREAIEDRVLRLQPVFAFTRTGKAILAHTRLRGEVRARRIGVPLAGVNVRVRNDSAFVFTSFYGDVTPADSAALELVARGGVIVGIDSTAAGVAIPADGFVVAARGGTRSQFARSNVGDSIRWAARFDGLTNVFEMVGGYPMLLLDARPVHHDETGLRTTFADRRHPRAAIGRDKRGRIHIVVVDGRRPGYSDGMTLQELADYLLAHGVADALNLDGGGSATLIVRGEIANRPTDASGERAVANALVVVEGWRESCSRNR